MNNNIVKCPVCGSTNVLPYEEENKKNHNTTFFIILLSALIIVFTYLTLTILAYLSYPILVLGSIAFISYFLKSKEKKSKLKKSKKKEYICLDCNSSFEIKI